MIKCLKNFLISVIVLAAFQNSSYANVLEFAQVSDVHYSLGDSVIGKYLYFLVMSLNKQNPNFVMFLGDNVDKSKEEDVIGLMRSIHGIQSPYYLALGKTDAHRLNGIEKEIYIDIVSTFNNNQSDKFSYYYFKPNKDVVCVVLDDSSDFAQSTHGEISDEQVEWLNKLLDKYPKKLFLIFHHTPIIPPRIEYKLTMINTEKYEEVLKKHSNVILISSGQYHQASFIQDDNGVRHICAPAFKDIPHSYQLIKVIYDKKSYKNPKNVEITVSEIKA